MEDQEKQAEPAPVEETPELDQEQLDQTAGGILIGMLLPAIQKVR